MESIKGSELNVPDAVFAWVLDGRGGARPLEDNDVIDSAHPCWLHLNYTIRTALTGWRRPRSCPITCAMRWRVKACGPA